MSGEEANKMTHNAVSAVNCAIVDGSVPVSWLFAKNLPESVSVERNDRLKGNSTYNSSRAVNRPIADEIVPESWLMFKLLHETRVNCVSHRTTALDSHNSASFVMLPSGGIVPVNELL